MSGIDRDKRACEAIDRIADGLKTLACIWLASQAEAQAVETSSRIVATPAQREEKRELTVMELAVAWGVSDRSIYEWKRKEGLPFKKVGRLLRFDWAEADQWAQRHREAFGKARLRVVK